MNSPVTSGMSIGRVINNMENNCPKCGQILKVVPEGVSKRTRKPYKAFLSCTRDCGHTASYNDPNEVRYTTPEVPPEDKKPAGQLILDSLKRIEDKQDKIIKAVTEVYEPPKRTTEEEYNKFLK